MQKLADISTFELLGAVANTQQPNAWVTKLSILKEKMREGDWRGAISLASKFGQLGPQRNAILDAQGAYTNPRFYTQIEKDPDALIEAGKRALIERYGSD